MYSPSLSTPLTPRWQDSLGAILDVGRYLTQAKGQLEHHGEWGKMVEEDLPFGRQTAFRLIAIVSHPILSNVAHGMELTTVRGSLTIAFGTDKRPFGVQEVREIPGNHP